MANHENQNSPKISEKTDATVRGMSFEQFLETLKAMKSDSASDPALLAVVNRLDAMSQADARRELAVNKIPTGISEFDPDGTYRPEGDDRPLKPKLRDEVFFEGVKQQDEQLTGGEVALFNRITTSKDARKGTWQAVYTAPVGTSKKGRLMISCGVGSDLDKGLQLPPLSQILTELSTGADATDVVKLLEQVAAMQEQLKSLQAARLSGHSDPVPVSV